jgi:hypothetical protein
MTRERWLRIVRSDSEEPRGPWMYTDSLGREYLVQLVPMERDHTLAERLQPKAVVFQTEEGWIRVSPVGHDFSPGELSSSDMALLLKHASGEPPTT